MPAVHTAPHPTAASAAAVIAAAIAMLDSSNTAATVTLPSHSRSREQSRTVAHQRTLAPRPVCTHPARILYSGSDTQAAVPTAAGTGATPPTATLRTASPAAAAAGKSEQAAALPSAARRCHRPRRHRHYPGVSAIALSDTAAAVAGIVATTAAADYATVAAA